MRSSGAHASNQRKLLFVTGTRADYGKLEPLAIEASKAGFPVTFFVTGMHMMHKYGLTKTEVHRRTEFEIVEYINQREGDPQDIVAAKTIVGFSDFLIMSANFGQVAVGGWIDGDLDFDGVVGFSDFLITSSCFGCVNAG